MLCRVPSSPWHFFFRLRCTQSFPAWKSDGHRCDPCSSSLNLLLFCYTLLEMRGAELHRALVQEEPWQCFLFCSLPFEVLFSVPESTELMFPWNCLPDLQDIFPSGNLSVHSPPLKCEMTAFRSINCFAFICPEFCISFYSPVSQVHKVLQKFLKANSCHHYPD